MVVIVVSASYALSIRIGNLESRIAVSENLIINVREFGAKENIYIEKERNDLKERIRNLETWADNAPPQWFKEGLSEFKIDIKTRVIQLIKEMAELKLEIIKLKLYNEKIILKEND